MNRQSFDYPVNEYDFGRSVRFEAVFTVNDNPSDPTAVALLIAKPDGTTQIETYAGGGVSRSSTGTYYRDVLLNQHGIWYYRFNGTGTVVTGDERAVYCKRTEF